MLTIENASIKAAQDEMSKQDDYTNHTTPAYRGLFAKTDKMEDFLLLMKNSVINPTEEQSNVILTSQNMINASLKHYNLDINFDMQMIYTDGTDNVAMPYTKGASMVMPSQFHFPPNVLSYLNPHLVAHELWHILSRAYPELRKAAYKAIGFREADKPLSEKEGYSDFNEEFNFINPDAIYHDHYLEHKGLLGKVTQIYPSLLMANGGAMVPGLIYVQGDNIKKIDPLYNNQWYVNSFKNIGYITHPEEICAEHFRLMIMDQHEEIIKHLPDQEMMANFMAVVCRFFNNQS